MGVKLRDFGELGLAYHRNVCSISNEAVSRLFRPWLHSDFMYKLLGYNKKLDESLVPAHEFTKSIIANRKLITVEGRVASSNKAQDNVYGSKQRYAMMDTLLKAQQLGLIDEQGILEETNTFVFAGHDTVSTAMTFTLLLLGHHPEVQERIFHDIQELSSDELNIDDVNKLAYLDRVVKESLRIYPPVPMISRELSEDLSCDGVTYAKGTICNIHIFDLHRDTEVFPDPEKFDPDRFLPENCRNRSNFAFIPFSAGMLNLSRLKSF